MKRTIILSLVCLAYGISQSAFAEDPSSVAIVESKNKPSSFYATKNEAKDYQVLERRIKARQQAVPKEVFAQPRAGRHKRKLPWEPFAPGD
jgi:hypothetical protein